MGMEALREKIAACLQKDEKLLLCCAGETAKSVAAVAAECAVTAVSWEPDLRWQNLARLAILNRTGIAVGTADILLGLAKMGKATGVPLPIRDVFLIGPSCPQWMKDSIANSLDAEVYDFGIGQSLPDPLPSSLQQELLRWSSVLDYRAKKTEMGLSLELVVFPGKQLPQLPSGAKVTVRPWVPASDKPFSVI